MERHLDGRRLGRYPGQEGADDAINTTVAEWAERNPRAFSAMERKCCGLWMAGNGGNATAEVLLWLRSHGRYVSCDRRAIRDNVRLAEGIVRLLQNRHPQWFE